MPPHSFAASAAQAGAPPEALCRPRGHHQRTTRAPHQSTTGGLCRVGLEEGARLRARPHVPRAACHLQAPSASHVPRAPLLTRGLGLPAALRPSDDLGEQRVLEQRRQGACGGSAVGIRAVGMQGARSWHAGVEGARSGSRTILRDVASTSSLPRAKRSPGSCRGAMACTRGGTVDMTACASASGLCSEPRRSSCSCAAR